MNNIGGILKVPGVPDEKVDEENIQGLHEEQTKRIINYLFSKFEAIFPKFWVNIKSQEHLNSMKREWFDCFRKSGISNSKLFQRGLDVASESTEEYLPKASKFIEWCRTVPGMPDSISAFNIACDMNQMFSEYSHEDANVDMVIRHAVSQLGSKDFREMPRTKSMQLFEHAYEVACRQLAEGKLKPIQKAIEDRSSGSRRSGASSCVLPQYEGITREEAMRVISELTSGKK